MFLFVNGLVTDVKASFGVNTKSADALAPKVVKASGGMVLAVRDRQHILLFQSSFHLLVRNQIQDTIQNADFYLIIFKTIQDVKKLPNLAVQSKV